MASRLYQYVGPEEIRSRSAASPCGKWIETSNDLRGWLAEDGPITASGGGLLAATFVIDPEGRLRLADRRSEHVACSGGRPSPLGGRDVLLDRR